MNRMKYIMFEGIDYLIFPEHMTHSEVAGNRRYQVTSAGFVEIYINCNDALVCRTSGDSFTLGVKSKPEDAIIIGRNFGIERV